MSRNLYYLIDTEGWYRSVVYILGEPWSTKHTVDTSAVRYTHEEMLRAKEYLRNRKVKVNEMKIHGERKFDRFGNRTDVGKKTKNSVKKSQSK
jgi:hypothetical protein